MTDETTVRPPIKGLIELERCGHELSPDPDHPGLYFFTVPAISTPAKPGMYLIGTNR